MGLDLSCRLVAEGIIRVHRGRGQHTASGFLNYQRLQKLRYKELLKCSARNYLSTGIEPNGVIGLNFAKNGLDAEGSQVVCGQSRKKWEGDLAG